MLKRIDNFVLRRLAPLAMAGVLLQAGGCQTTAGELTAGLASAVATNLINSFVFSAFGLTP